MRRQFVPLIPLLLLLAGCHSYHAAGASIPTDAQLRVQLEPARPLAVRAPNGTSASYDVSEVTGHLLGMRGDTIVMRPSRVRVKDELASRPATNLELVIVRDPGTRVGVYRADRVKTTVLTTAIAATVLVGGFFLVVAGAMLSTD